MKRFLTHLFLLCTVGVVLVAANSVRQEVKKTDTTVEKQPVHHKKQVKKKQKKAVTKPADSVADKKIETKEQPKEKIQRKKQKEEREVSAVVAQEPFMYELDRIEVVIFAPDGVDIITKSDVERSSLSGTKRTVDEIVFEKVVHLDAKKHKITPNDDEVDSYLGMVQKENNVTLDELKAVFKEAGYTFDEVREQFKIMQSVNRMLDFKIRSNLIVPRKEIEAYYEQNPQWQEARYQLEYALVPFDVSKSEAQQIQEINDVLRSDKSETDIPWGKPFWVNKDDVADDKQFIFALNPGEVAQPQKTVDGFAVYRLKSKTDRILRTLEDRRMEITDLLRRPRYFQLLEDYKKSLFDAVSIVYF